MYFSAFESTLYCSIVSYRIVYNSAFGRKVQIHKSDYRYNYENSAFVILFSSPQPLHYNVPLQFFSFS